MPNHKVLLLGLGMQGKAALHDLVHNSDAAQIIVGDNRSDLEAYIGRYPSNRVIGKRIDAADEMVLASLMRGIDVVIEALPGSFALSVGKLAAKLGVNLVSSMYYFDPSEQDPVRIQATEQELAQIDREAKDKGVAILPEFGLDPGLDLILGAKALSEMNEIKEFYSYGAGLPASDTINNPLKYKFSWSVIGALRAYMRPAKIISKGEVVEIGARGMFEPQNYHILELDEIGSVLECYPTGDSVHYAQAYGIRDSVKEMARYSCRLPGHCAFWDIMVKSGFLDEDRIRVGDASVTPIEFTAALLGSQEQFHYGDDEKDMTLIRIDTRGLSNGDNIRVIYQLIDWRDLETGFTSMQRTVGFTMSFGAQMILSGQLQKPGLLSPLDVPFDLVTRGLERHNLHITRQEHSWE